MLLETHKSEIETILERYADQHSAVLPLLYIAQDTYGHLTDDAIAEVAQILNMPVTDVYEVVGFYTLFYDRPVGTWMLQVCDDVPCCYLGAEELITALKDSLGIKEEETTSDGMFTLQRVKCLAACDRAPMLQANLDYVYDVTPDRVDALLADLRSRAAEAKKRGVSGRFADDYEFDGEGRPSLIPKMSPYQPRQFPAPEAPPAAPEPPPPPEADAGEDRAETRSASPL
jgi:NADH-quinone oxidoreductase subunit E